MSRSISIALLLGGAQAGLYFDRVDSINPPRVDRSAFDAYGRTVAVDGDIAIIGAPGGYTSGGSAFIHDLNTGLSVRLDGDDYRDNTDDAQDGHGFASSVAVSGDTVVVGAWKHYVTPVFHAYNSGSAQTGAVYVFETDGTLRFRLTAPDSTDFDRFGNAVAIHGDVIAIGRMTYYWRRWRDVPDQEAGVYFFHARTGAYLGLQHAPARFQELHAGNYGDYFGSSLAMSSTHIVISAPGYEYADCAVYADSPEAGLCRAVFVFSYTLDGSGTSLALTKTARLSIAGVDGSSPKVDRDAFAQYRDTPIGQQPEPDAKAVAISGDYIVVAATETSSSMLNDDSSDPSQGAAIIFNVMGDRLGVINAPSRPRQTTTLGCSVGILGNLVLVGDVSDPTTGRGVVYAYEFDFANFAVSGGGWNARFLGRFQPPQRDNELATYGSTGDYFGGAIAVAERGVGAPVVVVGAETATAERCLHGGPCLAAGEAWLYNATSLFMAEVSYAV